MSILHSDGLTKNKPQGGFIKHSSYVNGIAKERNVCRLQTLGKNFEPFDPYH